MIEHATSLRAPSTRDLAHSACGRVPHGGRRLRRFPSARAAALGLAALLLTACGAAPTSSAPPPQPPPPLPAAALLPADSETTEGAIRFLEDRVKRDPADFIAQNKLAGYYLKKLRETGRTTYIGLASRAAKASLAAIPAEQNVGGLVALAQVESASHQFAAARDHAKQLIEREPRKSYPYLLLGDSLLELGDYDGAAAVFRKLEAPSDGGGAGKMAIETRLARLALLRGETDAAQRHLIGALTVALDEPFPPRETVAWCRWQLGEVAFSVGDYRAAERHYRDALITSPDYFNALASLGRVRAAQGDLPGAVETYQRAIQILPDPAFIAALGDLHRLAGREKEAAAQYESVERLERAEAAGGEHYHHRRLAMFYADHDMKAGEAYADAAHEYEERRDIYGADALAWTALKAGKLTEAQAAMKDALRLGTRDAKLFYHAGMIARAAGEKTAAREYLERALKLNPQFDPLQAAVARRALEEVMR
jgi:tetratricopeptide (TPR) repeat protein